MLQMLTFFSQPTADKLMEFGSPQPFVPLYAVVLGKGGHVFMNVICILALWLVRFRDGFSRSERVRRV